MILFLSLLACNDLPDVVTVTGEVYDSHSDDSLTVAGADVIFIDGAMEVVDQFTTDSSGAFSALGRAGSPLYVSMSAEGFMPTGVAGTLGFEDYDVPDGALWLRSIEDHEAIEAEFEGCDTLVDGDGAVEGEVLMAVPGEGGNYKAWVETAWVTAVTADGVEHRACYLNDEGVFDSEATMTGTTGRFAVWGVSGPVMLMVGYSISGEPFWSGSFYLYVPEDGVAPLYDALWLPTPVF